VGHITPQHCGPRRQPSVATVARGQRSVRGRSARLGRLPNVGSRGFVQHRSHENHTDARAARLIRLGEAVQELRVTRSQERPPRSGIRSYFRRIVEGDTFARAKKESWDDSRPEQRGGGWLVCEVG
jgi:hypothetical protein